MHQHRAGFTLHRSARRVARFDGWPAEADRRSAPAHVLLLDPGSGLGHHDERRDTTPRRGIRHRRAMIARRVRHHALTCVALGQREHGVAGAARLERAGALEVLRLEEELRTNLGVERMTGEHRCAMDVRRDPRLRCAHCAEVG